MSAPQPMTADLFYRMSLEYYVNGRSSCLAGSLFTTGNLLHHAIELILKGELSRTNSLDDLKKKFGHSLVRCWAAFKSLFPAEALAEFDRLIAEIDTFETIRYPDEIIANGATIGFGFGSRWIRDVAPDAVPGYAVAMGEVDAFFDRVMRLCHMNIPVYFQSLTAHGREVLLIHNEQAVSWLA